MRLQDRSAIAAIAITTTRTYGHRSENPARSEQPEHGTRFAIAAAVAIGSTRVQPSHLVPRTSAWCGLVVVLMLAAGCSGGESTSSPTGPTPTPTPAPTPTTPSTPSNFTAGYIVSGGDCNATSNSPVSCTFVAQVNGGQGPFTYTWEFHAENLETVTMTGQSVRPTLDCRFSTGESQFRIYFALRVDQSGGGASVNVQNDQRIYRVAGHC